MTAFGDILLPLLAAAVLCITTFEAASQHQSNRLRVLLIRDPDKQNLYENAASLSVDLPRFEMDELRARNSRQNPSKNQSSDSGYRQTSLSSLTLHQREPKLATLDEQPKSNGNKFNRKRNGNVSDVEGPILTEIHMNRIKPSWLEISKQFQITASSIDQVSSYIPNEYLLRPAFDSPILLQTKLGLLEGVRSIVFNKHLYTFLGVPYARPPVGELRFKAPQPVPKWEGIFQATKWPPFCVQPSMTLASKSSPIHVLTRMMTEDCLYLNIWTPSLKFNPNHKRPVMVWIHGGAFQFGGISVDENDGSALAIAGDVVLVSLNYRVSAFGFLNANNKPNAPNNVGLLDQRTALEWVQANIRQFGGDPQQVTLFGESAGGHSVGLHMISPGSQSLFRRAILQSGVPISMLRSYDFNPDNRGPLISESISSVMMARRLKCYQEPAPAENTAEEPTSGKPLTGGKNETDSEEAEPEQLAGPILSDATIDCMRNKSSLEILKAMGQPGSAGFFPTGSDIDGFFPNGPIMESFEPSELKVGPQKDYLIGTNTDEGTFMLHYAVPKLFPARDVPQVETLDELKALMASLSEKKATNATSSNNNNSNNTDGGQANSNRMSEYESASGESGGGAQAHLYKPLMRLRSSLLDGFMPKSQTEGNPSLNASQVRQIKRAEFGRNIGSLITDIIFLCPSRSLARTLAENGRNVYFYLYTHRSSRSPYHDWIGVTHHDEVEFVFGRPLRMADVYSGQDIDMSQKMIKIWSHFAYTGQTPPEMNWPKYEAEDGTYIKLAPGEQQNSTGQRYHDRFCNLYDTIISVHLQEQ